jgi:hypothetical protein
MSAVFSALKRNLSCKTKQRNKLISGDVNISRSIGESTRGEGNNILARIKQTEI